MAASINFPIYSDALIVLGTAGVVVPLVHRFGLNPVLGYLAAGAILGPYGLGALSKAMPWLSWVTISDAVNVSGIADLGVVFLLFLIGLELSYERLVTMRRLVFGLGMLQVAATTAALSLILAVFGATRATALVLGACLALSSTAIVLEVLSNQGRMTTTTGRTGFAILLAQDLAVIPILMFISVLGAKVDGSLANTLGLAFLKAAIALALIILLGRLLLRPLFRLVAQTKSDELFIAAILFVVVATGVMAAAADLSMALGAFIAGLLLAETEFRKAIEAKIEPFKGLLLGVFFFTVGMNISAQHILAQPLTFVGAVIGLIGLKAAIIAGLVRLFGFSRSKALELALLLGPGGEFAFVGIGLAMTLGVLAYDTASFALAVTAVTMALIPLLATLARRYTAEPVAAPNDPALHALPDVKSQHAIVVGHGRVGEMVTKLFQTHSIAFTAIDDNPQNVARQRQNGKPVYFGSATSPEFLRACGIAEASAVVITVRGRASIDRVVDAVRELRPGVPIFARAMDAAHAQHLYELGVTDAVPETIEASLQLSEAALIGMGLATGPVIASIHQARDDVREDLQRAASAAGQAATRGLRARQSVAPHLKADPKTRSEIAS